MAYKCTNYGQCGQEFETRDERTNHESFCTYDPPPPPPSGEDQQKAS